MVLPCVHSYVSIKTYIIFPIKIPNVFQSPFSKAPTIYAAQIQDSDAAHPDTRVPNCPQASTSSAVVLLKVVSAVIVASIPSHEQKLNLNKNKIAYVKIILNSSSILVVYTGIFINSLKVLLPRIVNM